MGTDWNHITITYTNRQPRIYLNGVLVRTGLVSPRSVVLSSIQVGGNKNYLIYGQFPGLVSVVSVWNYARTQQDIQAEMMNSLSGAEAGLAGYWKLNEGVGMTAYDSFSNNNTSVINEAMWVSLN